MTTQNTICATEREKSPSFGHYTHTTTPTNIHQHSPTFTKHRGEDQLGQSRFGAVGGLAHKKKGSKLMNPCVGQSSKRNQKHTVTISGCHILFQETPTRQKSLPKSPLDTRHLKETKYWPKRREFNTTGKCGHGSRYLHFAGVNEKPQGKPLFFWGVQP